MTITETIFGPKTYLTLRKSITTDQVTDKNMYDQAGQKLGAYMGTHGITPAGPWTVLYFSWDNPKGQAEIGISFPVSGVDSVDDSELSIVTVSESNASLDILRGSHEGLKDIHEGLAKYTGEMKFDGENLPVIAVEEYLVGGAGPRPEMNPEKWETNVYYLHN